jgi:hypothetical protein
VLISVLTRDILAADVNKKLTVGSLVMYVFDSKSFGLVASLNRDKTRAEVLWTKNPQKAWFDEEGRFNVMNVQLSSPPTFTLPFISSFVNLNVSTMNSKYL